MEKAELKKNISKIKKLLTQRDIGLIDSGIEILRALDQKDIYEKSAAAAADLPGASPVLRTRTSSIERWRKKHAKS